MVNFLVTTVITDPGTLTEVTAALETAIEAVVDTKTIVYYRAEKLGSSLFQGVLVHTT